MKIVHTIWLIVASLSLAMAPLGITQETIDTGTITTVFSGNGEIGGGTNPGQFEFNGINGLWAIGPLWAYDSEDVRGWMSYSSGTDNGWISNSIGASTSFPFPELLNGVEADFHDGDGLDVIVNYYWGGANSDFIVGVYEYTNNTGGLLAGDVPGLFIDWDIGDPASTDEAVWDTENYYVFNAVTPNYFGVIGLNGTNYGGYDCFYPYSGDHSNIWDAMTTPGDAICPPDDQRWPVGFGIGDLASGATRTEMVAFVVGTDEADFVSNAADARAAAVAIEPGPDGLPGTHNLSSIYPNPFNPQANFTLEIAEPQNVRIVIYDALGRKVATLFNGSLGSGTAHGFAIDGATLPSGVYMVRVIGELFADDISVTLLK